MKTLCRMAIVWLVVATLFGLAMMPSYCDPAKAKVRGGNEWEWQDCCFSETILLLCGPGTSRPDCTGSYKECKISIGSNPKGCYGSLSSGCETTEEPDDCPKLVKCE